MNLVRVCPSCGNKNEVKALLCFGCRNNVAQVAPTESGAQDRNEEPARASSPTAEARPWNENLICPNPACEAENQPEEERCVYCNTPLTGKEHLPAAPGSAPASCGSGCPVLEWPWGVVSVGARLPIGRDPDFSPDLHLNITAFANVSNIHAEFRQSDGDVFLTDLGSTNGTFLNGRRLSPHVAEKLHPGDEVRFARDLKARYRV